MSLIVRFLNKPFDLLDPFRMRIIFASGMALFCTFFLYLFSPFNITVWIGDISPFRSFALPVLLIVGAITILLSQVLQSFLWKERRMTRRDLLLGFLIDVLFLVIPLDILYGDRNNLLAAELYQVIRMVVPILFLYYLIGLNALALLKVNQGREVFLQKKDSEEQVVLIERINITDESGQLRLSLKPADLLYIESADNYVVVNFRKEQRVAKELIRNSLKNMEEYLNPLGCIRCHRSFLVNLPAVHCLRKAGRSYEIEISGVGRTIPVSRGYVGLLKETLGI